MRMTRAARIAAIAIALSLSAGLVVAQDSAKKGAKAEAQAAAPTVPEADGKQAFIGVARVLQSPRCMNCHPAGDAPLQTDDSRPHAMNITRRSEDAGLKCAACHGTANSDEIGVAGGPPGAPNWHLPPKDVPMVFEGLTPNALCEQLKRPEETGGRTLDQLLHHVTHDALVLWGWNPGGTRTKPPLDHATFVAQFNTWVKSGGACPDP